MAIIRLDRYLADAGQGTRNQVKQLVRRGSVTINGTVVKQTDCKVNTDSDCVAVDGHLLSFAEYQYFMLHKPAGVVSATTDGRNKTVLELIGEEKRRDLFPVGRLDKDTEGLLIITNDGKMANNLLAPGKHVDKLYYAEVSGEVTEEIIASFRKGLDIGDTALTAPAQLRLISCEKDKKSGAVGTVPVSRVEIVITEGRYHQIKRMFQALGMEVLYLKRLSMGPITLDENLACGAYRALSKREIDLLKGVHEPCV